MGTKNKQHKEEISVYLFRFVAVYLILPYHQLSTKRKHIRGARLRAEGFALSKELGN